MVSALLGKKIGMTQVYDENGRLHPVTVVQAGPCTVLQVKTAQTDGYNAVQIGFEDVKPHRATRPQIGHAAGAGTGPKKIAREIRLDEAPDDVQPGATVTVEAFDGVPFVDVIGTSKGKGFAGVVKRYGFRGGNKTHGSKAHRAPGSIGMAATPARVLKGKKMPGHMGDERKTVQNLEVFDVRVGENQLFVKGSVPGASNSIVYVRQAKKNPKKRQD